MPKSFDTQQYTTDFNPLKSNPFVSVQDVMKEFGTVVQEIINLIPQLLSLFTPAQILSVLEQLLPDFLNLIFPTDGSNSPILSALGSFIGIPGLGDASSPLVQFGSLITGMLPMLTSALTNPGALLAGFLPGGGSILSQLTSGLGGGGAGIPGLIAAITSLPKDIANIFGPIPVGQLSTTQPNLLISPIFTADSVAPNPDWTIDTSTTRTADGSGSLKVTANGRPKALRSGKNPGDKIKVGSAQNLTLSIYAISQGAVTGTGGPAVLLQLQPFDANGAPLPIVTVASWTPSADTDWPHAQQLTGTYAVPDGVSSVQARLYLTEQAMQGVYHFDDGNLALVATMSVIPGLPGTLNTLDNNRRALMDTLASVFRGFPVVGTELADLTTAAENFNPLNMLGSLGSNNASGDLFGIVGSLIDAVKGQPHGTTTNGSLAQLYTAMNAAIHNTTGTDVTTFYDTTTVVPIQSWANQIDLLGVGKGQDGQAGQIFDFDGQGGQGGKVNLTTLTKGTHYDAGTGNITVTINSDGSVRFSWPAGTTAPAGSLTCAAGSGTQSPHFGSGYAGIGNAPVTYNGKPYALGGNQNTPGAAGLGPGGGGAGGGGIASFFQPGGPGAPGGGYVRQLAAATGTSTGADVTPPTGGTGHFVSATNTSITVSVDGATDA